MTFKDLGLHPRLLEGLDAVGFEQPTEIQQKAIPHILKGDDVIGSAQTGTGKTAAFLLPVTHLILESANQDATQCLVIVPTRELAIQIDQQMQGLSYFTGIHSIAVYGGGDGDLFAQEKKALSEGASIVIATPGRLIAHLKMGYVKFDQIKFLILDEADRMLDMGFSDDIMKIISHLPKERQGLLFSATMPPKIRELAKKLLKEPEEINIAISKPAERVVQVAFVVYDEQKIPVIQHVLTKKDFQSVIVFCSTKDSTKQLTRNLRKLKMNVADIHSDLDQKEREAVLNDFRSRKLNILVATDIVSRGIDIEDIELVINYDVPNDAEDYIHRIGRTARAASTGAAFTLINPADQGKFHQIEMLLGEPVPKAKLPSTIGEGPDYNPRTRFSKPRRFKKRR